MRRSSRHALAVSLLIAFAAGSAHAQTPIAGHYPPGQSGIRGAATPPPGWGYVNFSRLFTNLEVQDAQGATVGEVDELRYANISMFTWTTTWKVFGMSYGALAGVPFSTGNLTPSSTDIASSSFGLGPEGSLGVTDAITLRLRLQWEFATRNAVQGNNAWLIANFRL